MRQHTLVMCFVASSAPIPQTVSTQPHAC